MKELLEIGLNNAFMAAILGVLAAGLCRLYRRPAFAHGIWLIVLLKLVTPPLLLLPLSWFGTEEDAAFKSDPEPMPLAMVPGELPGAQNPNGLFDLAVEKFAPPDEAILGGADEPGLLPAAWVPLLFVVWLTGAAAWFIWIVVSTRGFHKLLLFAHEAGDDIQALAGTLAKRLGLARHPRVWLIPGAVSPMLWAVGRRPRLLFPTELLHRLDRSQLETLLVHELAHWRRRDHWTRFFELIVQGLYWWHPLTWWARGALREAEEQCCDAWVLAVLEGADRAYAHALLETVAFFSKTRQALPAAASGVGQLSHLKRRLTMIMHGQTSRSLTWAGSLGLLTFGLLLLPALPIKAQPPGGDTFDRELQVQVKDSSIDQEIQALRRLLERLEAKKRADAGRTKTRANPEEIERARAEIKELTRLLEVRRREAQEIEKKLDQARARLARLEGRPEPINIRFHVVSPQQIRFTPETQWKVIAKPAVIEGDKKGVYKKEGKFVIVSPQKETVYRIETVPAPARAEELKARLDRLLREVEALRRDMQRLRGPTPERK
jgi:bla regulator protein BlaR1